MDIGLARTYLPSSPPAAFRRPPNKLHLTQTAVSARIRTLEEQLGRPLFVRNKAGAKPAVAGERPAPCHAAGADMGKCAPPDRHAGGALQGRGASGRNSASGIHRSPIGSSECIATAPDIAVRAEVDSGPRLLEKVREGSLDLAVLHNPSQEPEVAQVELLCEEKLVS